MNRVEEDDKLIVEHKVICPDCGSLMRLRRTSKFKWKNGQGRLFYGCSSWPACKGTHGAHPDGRPLGVPADRPTKEARNAAHLAFDGLIASRHWRKGQGYAWLAIQLGFPKAAAKKECHIANFDIGMCAEVVRVCVRAGEEDTKKKLSLQF